MTEGLNLELYWETNPATVGASMQSMASEHTSLFKKLIAYTKTIALNAAALGLRDLHLTYKGIAMIFFAKSIITSQFSHIISTSLSYTFAFSSEW